MSDRVIEVRDVSKLYRLGEVGTGTISHDLNRWWARVRGKEDPFSTVGQVNKRDQKAESDYVWALKDINFDVHRGEILGIIGANGAGKSTLLKLMSRITSPTSGEIRSKGRIASLLEVGTGMHPEMTARENIYLNGSIMGMRRHEISRKFDDIIDFAGCADVRRHAGQAILVRHESPPRLRRRRVPRTRNPHRRRSPRRGRRRVPAQVPGEDAGYHSERRTDGALRQPQHGRSRGVVHAGSLAPKRVDQDSRYHF